eukprot:m.5501 g.5501  ORF g.5501 m.5501 type:complete len:71 (+) comp4258_c0_seq1:143-355(+)
MQSYVSIHNTGMLCQNVKKIDSCTLTPLWAEVIYWNNECEWYVYRENLNYSFNSVCHAQSCSTCDSVPVL